MGRSESARNDDTYRARANRRVPSAANLRSLLKGIASLSKPDRHECNLCGYRGRFWPFGDPPRRGATCAVCGSKERHRLLGLWVSAHSDAVDGVRILHFAPEPLLSSLFRGRSSAYQSADLNPHLADTVLNIEAIDLPADSVDLVVCSHVLEHVDDRKALAEMHRILRPGGLALLMFPIVEGWGHTYENPAHTSAADRTRYFAQSDHVRMFGADVRDRIRDVGFTLTEFTAQEPYVARYGLMRGEKVFVATKTRV
ncbi:class I SAM-dependent methyltransferase [Mycolicibacterium baixiangningiae]|uniref:class I SAM-dependent methyltransferase n=1 Tax=Mycolicibacterium baixiangningiae TaxID=2761578 RepID=UPI001E324E63|nr:class I SAM-dependent methyltransferase [Mycolicibacterium baixiangningiae]